MVPRCLFATEYVIPDWLQGHQNLSTNPSMSPEIDTTTCSGMCKLIASAGIVSYLSTAPILASFTYVATLTGPGITVALSPDPVAPGQTLTISDGGGCGSYPGHLQTVGVLLIPSNAQPSPDITVASAAPVDANGDWGPIAFTMPTSAQLGDWVALATCTADDGSGFIRPPDVFFVTTPS